METERISIVIFRHQNQAVHIDLEKRIITYRFNNFELHHFQSIEIELRTTNTIGIAQECFKWLHIPLGHHEDLMDIDAVIREIEKAIIEQ